MLLAQVHFEWTINIGTMIHLVTLIISMTVLYMKMTGRMRDTERRVKTLYKWVGELIRVNPAVSPKVIAEAASNGETDV